MSEKKVGVGIGVLIVKDNKVLLGKRKGDFGKGTWTCPGGKLEFRERISDCAKRETKEETGLEVEMVDFISLVNDVVYGKHYVTINLKGKIVGGKLEVGEPEKFEEWQWFDFSKLPNPLFPPTEGTIKTYLNKQNFVEEIRNEKSC
jgi:8-oxo-dGTP diphosphatase